MNHTTNNLELTFERTIPASPSEVFDAWLDPEFPGNPWSMADKLLMNPQVDGFFYWLIKGNPHYGRFTELARPNRLQSTWMSRSTSGEESLVTLTFEQQGDNTLMRLVHSGLPDNDRARGHEKGWNMFLDNFHKEFETALRQA
jgi:uncharacterized protein YndB with AHSA1/START domain